MARDMENRDADASTRTPVACGLPSADRNQPKSEICFACERTFSFSARHPTEPKVEIQPLTAAGSEASCFKINNPTGFAFPF
jgi:hypothetical protein